MGLNGHLKSTVKLLKMGKWQKHLPCKECGSSDANTLYEDGTYWCYSCHTYTPKDKEGEDSNMTTSIASSVRGQFEQTSLKYVTDLKTSAITDRGITLETCKKYGVKTVTNEDGDITHHQYPYYDKHNSLVAYKIREVSTKNFRTSGEWPTTGLFGQHLFNSSAKYVTVCEGELDAMAAHQMLGNYPVVSIRNGAGSALKDCKRSLQFLDSFDNVVLCFDSDSVGRKAAQEVADLFSPGKCHILTTALKDPCDYLIQRKTKDFVSEWFNNKKQYTPDGIICLADMWDTLSERDEIISVDYPWSETQRLTYGMRIGELCTFAAGTGAGKSTTVRELAYHILMNSTYNIGMLFLEESVKRTGLALLGIHANKPMHLPTCEYTNDEFKEAFDAISMDRRVFLFDHFGSWGIEQLLSRVRFMAKGMDCKFIFLDHISIIVSSQEFGDERRAIDEVMTKLRMLVQELNIHLGIVTHLKRVANGGHEEGHHVSLSHLRGSQGIAQLSDMVLGLERDSQNEDEVIRNTTLVRVLKNRFSGDTGPASYLRYDRVTGRQTELDPSEREEEQNTAMED
jgi:twinkle protein